MRGDWIGRIPIGGVLAALSFLLLPAFFVMGYYVRVLERTIGAAFDLDALKPVLLSSDYVVAILMPFVVGVALNIVGFILGITIIGLLLVPFVSFYAYITIFRMFGLAFAKSSSGASTHGTGRAVGA